MELSERVKELEGELEGERAKEKEGKDKRKEEMQKGGCEQCRKI